MINELIKSQKKLLEYAQKSNQPDLVDHILSMPFLYKGYGCIHVSNFEAAEQILFKYINQEDVSSVGHILKTRCSLDYISKVFYFSNEEFSDFLKELFFDKHIVLYNVVFFKDDEISL